MSQRPQAAILAVGTEITDGQVVDRNSAWISQRLTEHGIDVIEHRSVPDDRIAIHRALLDLSGATDLLFVTGGLGPTSDDFTREVVADAFQRSLEFDDTSWTYVSERLKNRGVPVRESQRQQCFFPKGSEILKNPLGTANAFTFKEPMFEVFVLPGPPAEIAAVWESTLASRLEHRVSEDDREDLRVWRCLGKGESELADLTEKTMAGSGLRLGYRAHVPYVEVKVWIPRRDQDRATSYIAELDRQLVPWLVNRDDEDLARNLLSWLTRGGRLDVFDGVTRGLWTARIQQALQADKSLLETEFSLSIHSEFAETGDDARAWVLRKVSETAAGVFGLALAADPDKATFVVAIHKDGRDSVHEIASQFALPPRTERARKFIVEKSLQLLAAALGS